MKIVIIGSGNVAAVLGRKFVEAGHTILQVVGRNRTAASDLAYEWNTVSTNYYSPIDQNADVYIVAVSDDAIEEVTRNLQLNGKIVAHTAASVPMEVLARLTPYYGVFYPLQSLRKEMNRSPEIPIFFEGSDEQTKRRLAELANSISSSKVSEADGDTLLKMHVAAVIVSNFTNHLYALAEEYCKKEGLDFQQLYPLILETAERVRDISPRISQTGPASRDDQATINKHLAILSDYPHLKKVYEWMSQSLRTFAS